MLRFSATLRLAIGLAFIGICVLLTSRTLGFGQDFEQLAFVVASCTLLYSFYLENMLNHLDLTKMIPDRVRAALDTFAEGLLVLDLNSRIVLANRAFAETLNESIENMHGRLVTDLPWHSPDAPLPWADTLGDGMTRTGRMVDLRVGEHRKITYMVNASPILSDTGELQGILASFDDVTLHEQRKRELENTLRVLGESREQIRQQNAELRLLANRDPLTGCLNRRSFFEAIEKTWDAASVRDGHVACIMIDVDDFKSVNDTHGHITGDDVLRCMGKTLLELETTGALVCRYGGEEFCLAIEGYDEGTAREFAEGIRAGIAAQRETKVIVTVSLGVAVASVADEGFSEVLDKADKSLYMAKRRGRNRVVCWSDVRLDDVEIVEDNEHSERNSDMLQIALLLLDLCRTSQRSHLDLPDVCRPTPDGRGKTEETNGQERAVGCEDSVCER